MARQPRFVLAGHAHLIEQQGHNGAAIVVDDDDRRRWLDLLRDTAASQRVALHAWGLGHDRFRLLATPPTPQALSRMMQTLGRRYVGAFNTRHARSGTLWDSRFRAALIEPGEWVLTSMCHVDSLGLGEAGIASVPHHLGDVTDPAISDPPVYWALGNTPFDRHAAYRRRLDAGIGERDRRTIEQALRAGRPLGSPAFVAALQADTGTVLVPQRRGRPASVANSQPKG